MAGPTQDFMPIPAERRLVVEQAETGFYVSLSEWRRLRRQTKAIREPMQWVRNLGWSCVTLVPASVLAWFPWNAAYAQLPSPAKLDYAWVGPAMVLLAVFSALGAVVCFFMNQAHQTEIRRDKASALEAMDAIEERHGVVAPPNDPAA